MSDAHSITKLNALDRAAFVAALGHLFEHSPWVADETWPQRPFRDAAHLHATLCATMRAAPHEKQLALIRAHPDLAGRLAQQNKLTAESTREQASAGLNQLGGYLGLIDAALCFYISMSLTTNETAGKTVLPLP